MSTALMARIARQTAASYHRTHLWLDRGDMEQEAWADMLAAMPSWEPSKGDLGGYLYLTASRACKRVCWRLTAAANVPMRAATEKKISRARAAVTSDDLLEAQAADQVAVDERIEAIEERERLALIVAKHLAACKEAEAVKAVLYGEMKSQEAAETFGLPLAVLYRRTDRVKQALRADKALKEYRR